MGGAALIGTSLANSDGSPSASGSAGSPVWTANAVISCPVSMSHNLTVWSWLHDASRLPSVLKATEVTTPRWPFSVPRGSPVDGFHRRIVFSQLDEARNRRSVEKA